MSTDLEQFLGGKTQAAKFEDRAYGTVIGGTITADPQMIQQRDYTTGDLMVYPDGNPQMQMVVKVQASPPTDDDDGARAFYVKGAMRAAVIDALKRAGETVPRKGGQLRIKYLRDEPVTLKNGRPGNPQKIYAAQYEPPAASAASSFLATATEAPPTAFASGGGVLPPEGVDPQRWAAMTPAQRAQMYEALGYGKPEPVAAAAGFRDEPPF